MIVVTVAVKVRDKPHEIVLGMYRRGLLSRVVHEKPDTEFVFELLFNLLRLAQRIRKDLIYYVWHSRVLFFMESLAQRIRKDCYNILNNLSRCFRWNAAHKPYRSPPTNRDDSVVHIC